MSELRIEMWPTGRLVPYVGNPRKNDQAVDRMTAVIREFGFRIPLVVRRDGELVDGHLRLKAAIALGMTEVPVMPADDMTPEQVRAFRLMVNRSATWATWDEDLLLAEIKALMDANYDVSFTGFDQHELDKLLMAVAATEKDPDAIPDMPEDPVVRESELWLLGSHRLLCGDATNSVHVGHLLGGKPASMVWTDPPYNVDYEGKAGKIKNDKMSPAQFEDLLLSSFRQMHTALQQGGAIYISHSEAGDGLAFRHAFKQAGFRFASCLIWNKGQAVLSRSDYHWQHEPILYGWKPGAAHKWYGTRKPKTVLETDCSAVTPQEDGSWTLLLEGTLYRLTGDNICFEEMTGSVIDVPKPRKSDLHPTTKPVELIAPCVANSSRSGGIVYDAFGGSGSTMIACEQLGRSCCTMELDPRFAQVDIVRWQNFTGRQAVRESDGRLFDELLG